MPTKGVGGVNCGAYAQNMSGSRGQIGTCRRRIDCSGDGGFPISNTFKVASKRKEIRGNGGSAVR